VSSADACFSPASLDDILLPSQVMQLLSTLHPPLIKQHVNAQRAKNNHILDYGDLEIKVA
jgi:hypothetical protein